MVAIIGHLAQFAVLAQMLAFAVLLVSDALDELVIEPFARQPRAGNA